jgi:hypothetical protein
MHRNGTWTEQSTLEPQAVLETRFRWQSKHPASPTQRLSVPSAAACQTHSIPGNFDAVQRPVAPFLTGPDEFSASSPLIVAAAKRIAATETGSESLDSAGSQRDGV